MLLMTSCLQFATSSERSCAIKDLAKIAGRIIALRPALGYFSLLVSRSAYASIAHHIDRFGWSDYSFIFV